MSILGGYLAREPLSNVTFSQWVDGGAGFSSLIEVSGVVTTFRSEAFAPASSCGREYPAGKE
jgi:hypothetical protein